MLKIKDYAERIDTLHSEGKTAVEISRILNFKYHQPIYNYFKKKGWKVLDRKEYPVNRVYTVDTQFFNIIDTEEKAYILGFICADGHVDYKKHNIAIALQDSDYLILEKIRNSMQSNHPIVRHIERKNPYTKSNHLILEQCCISINSVELTEPLKEFGILSKKTYTLNSKVIEKVPENLIRHFLRGYFDGDGSVIWGVKYSSGNKYIVQIAGNEEFLKNTYQKYFPSNCSLYKYKTSRQCFAWKIANKMEVLKFLNYIYKDSTIYLDRKYKIYKYAMWSFKTELIAGNSSLIELLEGQSAANPLVKCLRQVQRLADETITNPFEEEIEYNSATNAQHQKLQENSDEDIVRTT